MAEFKIIDDGNWRKHVIISPTSRITIDRLDMAKQKPRENDTREVHILLPYSVRHEDMPRFRTALDEAERIAHEWAAEGGTS